MHRLLLSQESALTATVGLVGILSARRSDNAVVHLLEVFIWCLALDNVTGRIADDELVSRHAVVLRTVHRSSASEGRDAAAWVRLATRPVNVAMIIRASHLILILLHLHM